ncbi:MAG: YkvA family protein, partial [Candidatus Ornithospirochaeta sp.]
MEKKSRRRKGEASLSEKEMEKAGRIVEDLTEKVSADYCLEEVAEAEKKAEKYSGRKEIAAIWAKIQVLFFIARHPKVWGPGVAVPASVAVLYLVLPFDAVPDAIPALGLLDDIFVITTLIAVLYKKIKSYTIDELSALRSSLPENLLAAYDEMFHTEEVDEVNDETGEEVAVDIMESATEKVVSGLGKAKGAVDNLYSTLSTRAEENPRLRKSMLFKAVEKVSVYSSAIPEASSRIAAEALKTALGFIVLKKEIKSLISFSFFALSLLFFYLSRTLGIIPLVLSSIFMVLSYTFMIHSIVKAYPRVKAFVLGVLKGGLEEGITAFILKECSMYPSTKEVLVKYGIREIKRNKEALKEMFLSFRKEILLFLMKMAL